MADWYIAKDWQGRPCITGPTWIEAPDWDADEAERQGQALIELAFALRAQENSNAE